MTDKIFGHDWADIQRAQRKGGSLHKPLVRQPLPVATDADRAALREHGSLEALQAAGWHGIVDRLSRDTGDKP